MGQDPPVGREGSGSPINFFHEKLPEGLWSLTAFNKDLGGESSQLTCDGSTKDTGVDR